MLGRGLQVLLKQAAVLSVSIHLSLYKSYSHTERRQLGECLFLTAHHIHPTGILLVFRSISDSHCGGEVYWLHGRFVCMITPLLLDGLK